jgi:hypothetical protein
MQLNEASLPHSHVELDAIWSNFSGIIDRAGHLGSYPFERIFALIERVGQYVDGREYDSLFDKFVDVVAKRRSEGAAGELLNRRGSQKLSNDRPYDAIRLFGRAEGLLVKEEYKGELVRSLVGGTYAYSRADLRWAARAKAIAALDICLSTFRHDGEMPTITLRIVQRILWVEVQLGRVAQILVALHISSFVEGYSKISSEKAQELIEERTIMDAILGMHLLNAPLEDLARMQRFPSVLERCGLTAAEFGLIYALGGSEEARTRGFVPTDQTDEEVEDFIRLWRAQPAAQEIPPVPILTLAGRSALRSTVLGVSIEFDVPDDEVSIAIAETILAAFEGFLATSSEDDLLPQMEIMRAKLEPHPHLGNRVHISFDDDDFSSTAKVSYPAEIEFGDADEMKAFICDIRDVVVEMLSRVFVIREITSWLDKVAGSEDGFGRALTLGNLVILNRNVFGTPQNILLSDWIPEHGESVRLTRMIPLPPANVGAKVDVLTTGIGHPPDELFDRETIAHTDREVASPINARLWDLASWRGTLFVGHLDREVPPILGLGFLDIAFGKKIFEEWSRKYGVADENEALRIAIIRGINAENRSEYAVLIGADLAARSIPSKKIITTISRINRMTPTSTTNLDRFLADFDRTGHYLLAPAEMNPANLQEASFYAELSIEKRKLIVRNAWEIGENDPDIIAIAEDATPVVPHGADAEEMLSALSRLKEFRAARKK